MKKADPSVSCVVIAAILIGIVGVFAGYKLGQLNFKTENEEDVLAAYRTLNEITFLGERVVALQPVRLPTGNKCFFVLFSNHTGAFPEPFQILACPKGLTNQEVDYLTQVLGPGNQSVPFLDFGTQYLYDSKFFTYENIEQFKPLLPKLEFVLNHSLYNQ